MELTITPFDKSSDNIEKVAWLFYVTDIGIMSTFFGKEKRAVSVLKNLIPLENNHFSHKYIMCAKKGKEIVGLLSGYDGTQVSVIENECAKDYVKALGLAGSLRAAFVAFIMQYLFRSEIDENEFYVNNLCVDPDFRSQGIGAMLLSDVCAKHSKVSLGVNANNHRGLKFYKRIGFEKKSGQSFNFFGKTIGAYHMVWTRKDSHSGSTENN